jgi:ABC-type multidrug transport system ATPase subunit
VDPIYREQIKAWIVAAKKTKGVMVSDHDYRNILDMSDRIALLNQGRLMEIKDPLQLQEYNYLLKRT